MAAKRTVVVGAKGQLGRALTALLPDALGLDLPEFDLRDPDAIGGRAVGPGRHDHQRRRLHRGRRRRD